MFPFCFCCVFVVVRYGDGKGLLYGIPTNFNLAGFGGVPYWALLSRWVLVLEVYTATIYV